MNSNYGKNFDFDLGLGSSRTTKSLNDQKNNNAAKSSYSAQPKPAWQPNKPAWTPSPSPGSAQLGAPSSMVGDIFGKSWAPSNPSSGVGIGGKDPNLFGDLVNSALGQGKSSSSNVSLKNAKPSSFSVGNLADSLPKSVGSNNGSASVNYAARDASVNNLGSAGSKDPFGSFVDFGSKPTGNVNLGTKSAKVDHNSRDGDGFGAFMGSTNPSPSFDSFAKPTAKTPSPSFDNFAKPTAKTSSSSFVGFDNFANPTAKNPSPSFDNFANPTAKTPSPSFVNFDTFASTTTKNPSPSFNMDDFTKPATQSQACGSDPLDMLFTPSRETESGFGGAQSDDWGMEEEPTTTELEGLPPPPAGVNASAAKSKGMDNYRQGQYADAIKWLSWAVVLLEKGGGDSVEVLSSRASCYKEVGEYKKAVADCTEVLEQDNKNVSVLVQRALLYESMEKYRLGAEDLRTVLKIDPSNRLARSTVHRLNKLAD